MSFKKAGCTASVFTLILIFTCLTMTACGSSVTYSDDVAVNDLVAAVDSVLPESDKYASVPETYIINRIGIDEALFEECTVKINDSDEYGIFKASSEENTEAIEAALNEYFDSKTVEWEQYRTDELHKLENAAVKIMGKYVVFAIHDEDVKTELFTKAENELLGK